jgi:hypothetical protein
MKAASACGLGIAAPLVTDSLIRDFRPAHRRVTSPDATAAGTAIPRPAAHDRDTEHRRDDAAHAARTYPSTDTR